MSRNDATTAATRLGLRLVVTDRVQETDEAKATKFADVLEREYDLACRRSFGGMRFANCIEVDDFPEPSHVVRAVEILASRGYDAKPTDNSTALKRHGVVWISARDPNS